MKVLETTGIKLKKPVDSIQNHLDLDDVNK